MKKVKSKKQTRPEFAGKSREYQDGYENAEEYFDHILKGGNCMGSAPFRVFVEVVAGSMRNGESIGEERIDALECILKWSGSDFNQGVHDLLVKRVKEYNTDANANRILLSPTGAGKNGLPKM